MSDRATSHRAAQSRYRKSAKGRAAQAAYRARTNHDEVYYYKRGGRENQSIRNADRSIARYEEELAELRAAPRSRRVTS